MRRSIWITAAIAVAAIGIHAGQAATASSSITPTSIAGAKLGLGKVAYEKLLGGPARFQAAGGGKVAEPGWQQPGNYTRLAFAKRKLYVFFADGVDHAVEITTWNKAYRTAEGVGPCSTLAQLKAAYGGRLKPDPGGTVNGTPYSYFVGRSLLFTFDGAPNPTPTVTSVALYDGSAPDWNRPGGARGVAGFINFSPGSGRCGYRGRAVP